jgi:hypothetical protein
MAVTRLEAEDDFTFVLVAGQQVVGDAAAKIGGSRLRAFVQMGLFRHISATQVVCNI